MPEPILIVEDDNTIRVTVGNFLARQGFDVEAAEDGEQALALLKTRTFSLMLLDLHLPDMHGLDILAKLQESDDRPLVVIMTAYPEVRTAVAALKAGAYDYINKPFDLEDLRELIGRAVDTQRMRRELAWRRAQSDTSAIEGLIGASEPFRRMLDMTTRIASAGKVPVLIRGESGTGKEQIAQAIHYRSPRADGPWVTLNCSALPEGLLESELFGHERGAFTDAKQMKRGLLELADGGTLFLDEIGDLSLTLQPKLLRVLETQTFRRLGGAKEIRVDVRFVSATHRDLPGMVQGGRFREDLYYRLNVGAIDLPALRERQEDILPLAQHFLAKSATAIGIQAPAFDPAIEPLLKAYRWPGNVRELRNVVERAAILSGGEPIAVQHLPREIAGETPRSAPASAPALATTSVRPLAEIEAEYIRHALELCHGNKTQAAELLGITRLTLRNKLRPADAGGDGRIDQEATGQ
ncbi:Transcriptional regulatory protein ZraR [Azoarcus sp. Aa7]|nr:Transcriptional regulatory protein ZraR [Azoarcus sp. Aa7]